MRPSTLLNHIRRRGRGRAVKNMLLPSILLIATHGNIIDDGVAAFTLNWQRDYAAEGASFVNNDAYISCNMSYIPSANCGGFGGWGTLSGSHDDGTAFFQEQLTLGGQLYFHVIVGDYTKDSMAQEVFIKASGGNPTYYSGWSGTIQASDSVGNTSNPYFNMTQPYSTDSSLTGTGSANPNSVIMRQIINSGEISMQFLKDSFTQKPLITQTISNPDMTLTVSMDMRGSNYSQITPINTATSVTNTLVLLGSDRAGTEGNFNIQDNAQTSHLSAGGFTYTPGSGFGGSGGVYTWSDPVDNFQPMNRNYQSYCDPAQNRVWGSGACVGGGGGGGLGW